MGSNARLNWLMISTALGWPAAAANRHNGDMDLPRASSSVWLGTADRPGGRRDTLVIKHVEVLRGLRWCLPCPLVCTPGNKNIANFNSPGPVMTYLALTAWAYYDGRIVANGDNIGAQF
jgi:hypothetical protein